ncbi:glycosyltransferase family 2 protein [Serinibacter salmoneus]|uniref:Glycosyl transferase family 2 n=1 Tax=Serinibacter salmoneus TaxID=556530 RepID=A0A2A9D1E9_9MICO|nr:glycosyltransferase family A protein [Serinibacter salmoneus]PFG20473.1 glycosyl transferase family 2 [Serinibacter salmoneus]
MGENHAVDLRVTLAVLTHRRHEQIAALVPLLEAQARQALAAFPAEVGDIGVLVVDNEPDAAARDAVLRAADPEVTRYVCEPRPGIATARNRALRESAGEDLLVFIDDDETPGEGWLVALLGTFLRAGADPVAAVAGAVRTVLVGELDPWIRDGGFLARSHRESTRTGEAVATAATNNLLLDLRVVRGLDLWFEESLGLAGGEDTLFTTALTRAGERIVWCREAWVHDVRPVARLTRRAVVRRAFGHANASSGAWIALAHGPREVLRARAGAVAGGVARLCAGLGSLLLGVVLRSRQRRAGGVRVAARGVGMLTSGVGYRFEEYADS